MSEVDKAYYKEKSKGGGTRLPKRPSVSASGGSCGGGSSGGGSSGGNKFTSQGVPVAVYERQERERKHEEENMRRRIGSLIQTVPLMTGMCVCVIKIATTIKPFYSYANFYAHKHNG